MASSVVYAGVFGAVLASIRSLRTSVVAFDTSVADRGDDLDEERAALSAGAAAMILGWPRASGVVTS